MQRLKSRAQFQAVLAGNLIAKTEHFALHRCAVELPLVPGQPPLFPVPDTWVGAMTPKRWAKRAVTRNTIKRKIYLVANDFKEFFPLAAFIVRLRRDFSREEFASASSIPLKQTIQSEILQLFEAGVRAA